MLLDLHITQTLASVWPTYRDSLPAFQAAMAPYVTSAKAAEWHALLLADPPVFRTQVAPGTPERFPVISVELIGGEKTEEFLGNTMGLSGGNRTLGFNFSERVEITVLSKRDEITRCLCLLVIGVLLRAVPSFQKSNYINLTFDGAGELSLEELLVGEDLGIYARRLSYSSTREMSTPERFPDDLITPKPAFIQLDLVFEDASEDPAPGAGIPGGVTEVPE